MLLVNVGGPRQHDDLARARGAPARSPRFVAPTRARARSAFRSRPTSTRNRARCDSSATFAPNARATSVSLDTSPGHASPSTRASANRTGRLASETTCAAASHDMTASVNDECLRRQQRLDLLEEEGSLLAIRDQACRGRVQNQTCAFDLSRQRRDARVARCTLGPGERRARRLRSEATDRDPRGHQLVHSPRRGREGCGVEPGEGMLRLRDPPDQDEAPDFEIPRMRGVDPVAVLFECRPRGVEGSRRPAEIARGERNLGLGDDAPRAGHGFLRPEGARRTSQERLRANEIAELRHRDASKRDSGRVATQGDPLQRAEGITGREGAGRGRDQRIHRNPDTLVTPTARIPGGKSIS